MTDIDGRAERRRLHALEWPVTLAISAAAIAWARWTQTYQVYRFWDSDEYFLMAEQLAAGVPVTAAMPYAFRLLTPWLAGQCCPDDIQHGFLFVNLAAGITTALLLIVWLRQFVSRAEVRLVIVALFALQWHAPLRFSSYYPAYVDPVFQALMLAALIVGHRLWSRPSSALGLAYVGIIVVGTLAREMTLLVPAAALAGMLVTRGQRGRSSAIWQAAALVVGVSVFAAVRLGTDPRQGYTFFDAIVLHVTNKRVESLVLTWLLTYGPLVAVVAYDWRNTRRFLIKRPDLGVLLAGCFALSHVGGHDTERHLFWAMPVVYLLIALSLERQSRLLSGAVVALLVVGQVLAQRVLWPVPDPQTSVTALSATSGLSDRVYAVLNRVFVIDDFHWNLWSNFGSRPFHLVQLALYGGLAVVVVMLMRRNAARVRSVAA